ncbi:DUF5408 family protein [Helicobacter pylori]|nr:DUF5408 family protein [Helicobacter pylori]WQW62138.1 DUF5408 family protein [Helicobacter pylori]
MQNEQEAREIAKKAVQIVFFLGIVVVLLMMINLYMLINQINASAKMSQQIKKIEERLNQGAKIKKAFYFLRSNSKKLGF